MTVDQSQPALIDRLVALAERAGPARIALRDGERSLHYTELPAAVVTLADWLRGLGCAVVGVQADNSVDWVLVDLACQAARVICLPLPDFFSEEQRRHCITAAGVDLLIGAEATPDTFPVPSTQALHARRVAQLSGGTPSPSGTRKITFTSGSTGAPKGVCLDAALPWRVAQSLADVIAIEGAIEHVRHLCLLPLPTLLENIAGVYAPLLCGGEVILPNAATRGLSGSSGLQLPTLLHCIATEKPHSLILLPQLLRALVAACQQGWQAPDSLQFIAVGGAHVAADLITGARALGLPVYEGYGLSECGSVVALNTPRNDRPGRVGQVLPHCSIHIENNEIVVRGATHLGYLGEPASWWPNRTFTGDLGRLRTDGHLVIAGRSKNLIITSYGRNVSPEWVESELCVAPLLSHCVVVGEARPHLAALLTAAAAVTDGDIQRWIDSVNLKLPDYARVRTWRRVPAADWHGLFTANGRPRRALINGEFATAIAALFAADPAPEQPSVSIQTSTESFPSRHQISP